MLSLNVAVVGTGRVFRLSVHKYCYGRTLEKRIAEWLEVSSCRVSIALAKYDGIWLKRDNRVLDDVWGKVPGVYRNDIIREITSPMSSKNQIESMFL